MYVPGIVTWQKMIWGAWNSELEQYYFIHLFHIPPSLHTISLSLSISLSTSLTPPPSLSHLFFSPNSVRFNKLHYWKLLGWKVLWEFWRMKLPLGCSWSLIGDKSLVPDVCPRSGACWVARLSEGQRSEENCPSSPIHTQSSAVKPVLLLVSEASGSQKPSVTLCWMTEQRCLYISEYFHFYFHQDYESHIADLEKKKSMVFPEMTV